MKTTGFSAARRLLLKASAALSAPLTLTAAHASRGAGDGETLAARVAALEDTAAIHALQRAYVRHLSAQEHAAAAQLFADPERAQFGAEVRGLSAGTGSADDRIEIAPDRRTARARMQCTVRLETSIEAPSCTLLDMARLQGEGVLRRTERRVLEQTFVRRQDGAWKIEHAAYTEAPQA